MHTTAIRLLFTAMVVALGTVVCRAQALQYLLDTVAQSIYSAGVENGVTATADGGTIVHLTTPSGEVQWKMDQAGEPIWCKQYGISGWHRARMPDGGALFSAIVGSQWANDTIYGRFQVVRTDALGEVIWSRVVTVHSFLSVEFHPYHHHVATDGSGNCLITTGTWDESVNQFFHCLDADGNLLWSKTYQFNLAAGWTEHLYSDGMGGWYFGSFTEGDHMFRLGHLNPFGDLTWYNSYQWSQPLESSLWLHGLSCLDYSAVVVGHVYPWDGNGDYHSLLMCANLDGSLNWIRSYYGDPGLQESIPALGQCEPTGSGELLVSSGEQGIVYDMVRLSATGEVVGSIRPTAHTVAGITHGTWFSDWDVFDTTLIMGNYLVMPWDSINPPSWRPSVWRLPITDTSGCGMEANEIFSMLIPNSYVIVNDQPFSEVEVPVTIIDTVCSVTSFTPLTVSDYCYYFTGIPPVVQASTTGRVVTTLIVRGDPITVVAPAARCGITVHDAHGRMLYRAALTPNSSEQIQTSAWAPGLYFVRFQPEDGGRPNVVKVVIQ